AEFERVCLESDAMLAEVASCHHVLAMFLSGSTEIDPDTRQRLYRLEDDLAAALAARAEKARALAAAEGVAPAAPPAAAAASAVDPRPARRGRAERRAVAAEEEPGGFWSELAPWAPAIAA